MATVYRILCFDVDSEFVACDLRILITCFVMALFFLI